MARGEDQHPSGHIFTLVGFLIRPSGICARHDGPSKTRAGILFGSEWIARSPASRAVPVIGASRDPRIPSKSRNITFGATSSPAPPQCGVEAADSFKARLAYRHVAAGKMLGFFIRDEHMDRAARRIVHTVRYDIGRWGVQCWARLQQNRAYGSSNSPCCFEVLDDALGEFLGARGHGGEHKLSRLWRLVG